MNRYKFHHKVLSFLCEKYLAYNKDDSLQFSYTSLEISKQLNINHLKTEIILFDLKEDKSINYNKTKGFYIEDGAGISKQKSNFYKFKHKEHKISKTKELLAFIVSILAIISFCISTYINFKK
ncbi:MULTISPECIES: hypothetical protein [Flavobacterium]|uniref:Transcriptional regulator n=1 Tax=Flavobacterium jumunjinense TaxID=998845 RepID=A0ABV5GRC5_9FLAO|nr:MULTISPECIES: hypothetical protein [Flavobacterium]